MNDLTDQVISISSEVGEIRGSLVALKDSFEDHKEETNTKLDRIITSMTGAKAIQDNKKEEKNHQLTWAAAIATLIASPISALITYLIKH